MHTLIFASGNAEKFKIAQAVFAAHGITMQQARLDIDEIQEEDAERIALEKVRSAYEMTKQPVVINDDSWSIPGLGGFPGPYMKSVAHWFTAEDFLRLTLPLADRRTTLTQRIAYKDSKTEKVITLEYTGEILKEVRGNYGTGWQKIITMPGDNGLTVSEVYDRGAVLEEREVTHGWETFIKWYEENIL